MSPWELDGAAPRLRGRIVMLHTPDELAKLKRGTRVWSILGESKVIGVDEIDNDTRFGHTAWGLLQPRRKEARS